MDWTSQRGTITAVWVATLAAFILVGIAILEREWVNYQLQLVDQAADLAAEAGAYDHQVRVTIKATRHKTEFHQTGCVPIPLSLSCTPVGYEDEHYDYPTFTGAPRDVEGEKWKPLVNCGVDGWKCVNVEVLDLCVDPGPRLETTASDTFKGNWRDRRANRYLDGGLTPPVWVPGPGHCDASGVGLRVTYWVRFALRPFFGMLDMEQVLTRTGSAVVKVRPPALKL